jgi:anti-sigma factor RsiW
MRNVWNKIEFQSFKRMEGENMKCGQIRKTISQYVDDELGQDEKKAFASHIQGCSACREEVKEAQAIHGLFASAERFPAPHGFTTRVMANLEEKELSWFRGVFALRPFFVRAAEVAFAVIIMIIGVVSGNVLVADRDVPQRETSVGQSLSLDLFQATPPDSIAGVYVTMMGARDEK